ncbi:MAG: CpsD/CapB family tyrosine-protein kinase [Sedimenticola sp.]
MLIPERFEEIERIHAATAARSIRSLAVTAANEGEGVSTLALALARRNLLAGRSTLLVDLNLYRPSLHTTLDITPASRHEALLESPCIVTPDGGNSALTGISAPSRRETILRLREPGVLETQISLWQQEYDTIIFDTSPLSRLNGDNIPAGRVAAACDGCLLLVLAGETSEAAVENATQQLQSRGAKLLGCVLNDRHNPTLKAELLRETKRLDAHLPRLGRWMRSYIKQIRLLALDV